MRHKLSIKLLICIKSYAQSVFDIVRPFDILAVECDLKRSHIAFNTNQLTPFLPNPVTFLQVEFSRIRGRIPSYSTFSHICRIRSNMSNPMWDPGFTHFFPGPSPILMKFSRLVDPPERLTHTKYQLIIIIIGEATALQRFLKFIKIFDFGTQNIL